ncbi:hypothetical protein SDC9_50352 [bioreactor metagenome]|uniref:Uncharacterized protein n=1 Tax=bioreactor metagenome TaxID=1076179 RepID=A0A644WJV7_9ZZZZ
MSFLSRSYKMLCMELHLSDEGIHDIRIISMNRKGNVTGFDIIGHYCSIDEIPVKTWSKSVPVVILISGKGVITRRFTSSMLSLEDRDILHAFFPNTDTNEFVVSANYSGNSTWASVLRFSSINETLETVRSKGVFITGVYCGNHFVSQFYPFIPEAPDLLNTGRIQLVFNDKELVDIRSSEELADTIRIGTESIHAAFFPLLGCGFHALENKSLPGNHISSIHQDSTDFHWYSKYSSLLRLSLISIFTILLGNFFIFSNLNEEAGKLQTTVESNQNMLAEYDTLLSDFNKKRDFLEQAGLLDEANIAWYADQIASTTPILISLTGLNINPVSKSSEQEDDIVPESGLIEICGLTPDPVLLHTWVDTLSRKSWVGNARVMNYSQESRNGQATFTVSVRTKSEK